MELRGFSGNNSNKKWSYVVFLGKCEKNEVLAFFHVLIQESECTFGISVTIA